MKTKKIISALIAGILAATAAVSVSAATLTESNPDGSTEVKANIVDSGAVSYIITIPDTADFGALTQPESIDTDHYAFYDFQVEATELNIKNNQGVTVYMKDASATDNQFYISQKNTETPFTIAYDVYDTPVNADTVDNYEAINTTAEPGEYGYHLCTFLYGSDSKTQPVTDSTQSYIEQDESNISTGEAVSVCVVISSLLLIISVLVIYFCTKNGKRNSIHSSE